MSGRILFVDQFSQLGGAQRCLLNLLPAFSEANFVTHLAVPGNGSLVDRAASHGAVVHRIPSGEYSSGSKNWADAAQFACDSPRQASRIASLVRRHGIDFIYVNGPRVLPAAALAAAGRPVIFHAHSIVAQESALRLTRWAVRHSQARVIAACDFVLARLNQPGIACRRVIYNGIAPLEYIRRSRKDIEPWRIGVIGRIAPEKGQLEFVQAARQVSQHRRCQFVICGEAMFSGTEYEQRVLRQADGLSIHFLGWRDDVSEVLSALDLLVVPSTVVDATPLVILEAFSAGVPVLAFRSGGIPEMIDDGVTGILCSPEPAELARTLIGLMRCTRERLDPIARRAKAAFAARFSLERYQSEILQVVRHAM